MRRVGSLTISRLAGAVAAIWSCCSGPVWAGDGGGGSVETAQGFLGAAPNGSGGLCNLLGMTSCPQLPTLTQLVLQFSALQNVPPDTVRGPFGPPDNLRVGVGGLGDNGPNCSVAGNQLDPTSQKLLPPCNQTVAINSINPPLSSAAPPTLDPSSLALELGFSGVSVQGTALPVPAGGTPSSYFTAVTSAEAGGQLDTLNLYYQYPIAATTFPKGQQVAAVSFPLAILNSDRTERLVIATLQLNATCTGGTTCLAPTVLGNFSGNGVQKVSPSSLGVTWVLTLPNSASGLATLQVQVPLLVTPENDEAYFGVVPDGATVFFGYDLQGNPITQPNPNIGSPTNPPFNQVSGIPTAFNASVVHSVTFIKGATGAGIPPYAAPAVPLGTAVSSLTTWSYGFCASFWRSTATKTLNPAVAAFASIGTDGTAYASSPIAAQGLTLTCPF